ncbi:MAG: hypothetical protein JSW20_06585 [Nitrospiraceae bacterium]|nr:MAG: hypothetical protein JSW20_06585 [Nitrospiraceae bacterium]
MNKSHKKRHPKEPEPIIVDLKKKDTEYGWILSVDRMALKFVPSWFTYLSWILILAAFQFLFNKSDHWIIGSIIAFSSVAIWRYLIAVFWQYEFRGLPFIKSEKYIIGYLVLLQE